MPRVAQEKEAMSRARMRRAAAKRLAKRAEVHFSMLAISVRLTGEAWENGVYERLLSMPVPKHEIVGSFELPESRPQGRLENIE